VDRSGRWRSWARPLSVGALVSAASTSAGLAVAALASVDSPVAAVADATIDRVPGPVRRWAISTFGTSDKLALGIGIVVVLALVAAVVAAVAATRRWVATAAIAVFSVIGLLAMDDIGPAAVLASLASAMAGYVVFAVLLPSLAVRPRRSPFTVEGTAEGTAESTAESAAPAAESMVIHRWNAPVDRRAFVAKTGALWAGTAIVAGVAGAVGRSENASVTTARAKFPTVPAGSPDAAPTVPAGATLDDATPFITPNNEFYRIDTAFLAPRVTLEDWRLEISGKVDTPLSLSYDELLSRHIVERIVTLCCVSNEVGGDLIGTAKFIGVPLAELLEEVGVKEGGDQIAMTSVDGWTCGFPTEIARDGRDAMVAIGMNGEPLPVDHGFPVRIVVPGLYGYVSATKWVEKIELVGWDDFDGYWVPRGWSKEGPVKTQSRIDVPKNGDNVSAGKVAVAGIAWAQHRGIDKVEVQVDDGEWTEARVGDEVTIDAWRQWVYEWDATPGSHVVRVRATDREGDTQTSELAPPAPDGATGHHSIAVDVE
jgi:DMSO/TMAO reductase YedYZ molybdopterin-dependent catalytic subunit